jgi:hypothetical protein
VGRPPAGRRALLHARRGHEHREPARPDPGPAALTARRRALWGAPVLLVLVWLAVRGWQTHSALERARHELLNVKQDLLAQRLDEAQAGLSRAADATAAARSASRDPLWRLAGHVPVLGRSPAAVSGLSAATDDLAQQALVGALTQLKAIDPDSVRRPDGSLDVASVTAVRPGLLKAQQAAEAARARAARTPSSWLVPGIGDGRQRLLREIDAITGILRGAAQGVDMAPALLGEDRPRRYFVAVQQISETRGTGGLIGGYAVIRADRGRVSVESTGSDAELIPDFRPVEPPAGLSPGYVEAYANYDAFVSWQSINLSPDLPSVARVIAAKWKVRTGQQIDGVVALDGLALQDLLAGGPALRIGDRSVKPEELAEYLAVGQYEGVSLDPTRIADRKDRLTEVADDVLRRVTQSGTGSSSLVGGLVTALRTGHLRMASADPALAGLHATGVDGALPEGDAPVAYPVLYNAMGSKLDHWVYREVTYACGGDGSATVTVTLRNDLPKFPLPPYITLDVRANPTVRNSRVDELHHDEFTTRGATLRELRLDGRAVKPVTAGKLAGLPFWGVDVSLTEGKAVTVTLQLSDARSKAAVRFPEQPMARPRVTSARGCDR